MPRGARPCGPRARATAAASPTSLSVTGSRPATIPRSSSAASRATASARAAIALPPRDVAVLERGHRRVEHLGERRDVLHRPVVELLRDAASLGPLGEQPLGDESARRSIDHRLAERDGDRLGAGLGLELREDVADVALHRLLGDEELLRDVGVRHAVGEQLQDLALALR